jgi:hypothetical protein
MSAKSALTPDLPWPGTAAYGAADRAYFHGRKRETEELLRLIQRDVLTLVMGPAGGGKTSLIQAGLLPALVENVWLPIVPKLDWSASPPKSDAPDLNPATPVSLANPLSRTLIDTLLTTAAERDFTSPEPQPGETLWEFFHRVGSRWWSMRQRVVTPIVIIDGFESIFTTAMKNATAERQAAAFLKELSQLVANRPPQRLATRLENGAASESVYDFDPVPLRIVLVMRDEFASQLTRLRVLFPTLRRSELRVEPFTTSQARDVLMRGALQASLMSDATLDAVVAHLASDRGSAGGISPSKLSVLAHALAAARLERGAAQITPDYLPKPGDSPVTIAETSSSPIIQEDELRSELAVSESRRRSSQRAAFIAVLAAVIAVAAPILQQQFAPPKATVSIFAPASSRREEPKSQNVATPAASPATEPRPAFDSPFSLESPEYLPVDPAKPVRAVSTPEALPQPQIELGPDEPAPTERTTPSPVAHSAQPTDSGATPSAASATPRPATPSPDQSALSPDAQRQLNAASADRKEQQRREFLRRQQESRRAKETAPH